MENKLSLIVNKYISDNNKEHCLVYLLVKYRNLTLTIEVVLNTVSFDIWKGLENAINEYLAVHTGGRLEFYLNKKIPGKKKIETSKIAVNEHAFMWEQFNSEYSVPLEEFNNTYSVSYKLRTLM